MKRFLFAIALGLLLPNVVLANEKIYCVDLDSGTYKSHNLIGRPSKPGELMGYKFPDRAKNGKCTIDNVPVSIKDHKFVQVDRKFYKKFLTGYYASIPPEALQEYIKKKGGNTDVIAYIKENEKLRKEKREEETKAFWKEYEANRCNKKLKMKWSMNNQYATFNFTSESEKPIYIDEIVLYTKDEKLVKSEDVAINLKPFEIGSVKIYVGNLNRSVINLGSYACEYGSIARKNNNKKSWSQKTLDKIKGN